MNRTCFRRGPFGLRVTPADIEICGSFLRLAVGLVRSGRPQRALVPWVPWRFVGRPAPAFRRRP